MKPFPRRLVWALLIFSFIGGCARTSKLPLLADDAVILAFGDSLTYGSGATEAESYPAVLEQLIKRKVVRSGVAGELSSEGLIRLPAELERTRPALLILCHGGNDLLRRTGDASTEANLRAMVHLAKERGVAVVLVAVPRPGWRLTAAEYYERIARDTGFNIEASTLADILSDNSMKSDLAHPNAAGYRKLAEALRELLKKAGAV